MTTTLSIGLFGAGRIGTVHGANIAAHPRARLAVVCDPVPTAADALAGRYGAAAVTEPEQAFTHDLDAVVIASSTSTHLDLLTAAAQRGVPALCEKPIDLNVRRARDARPRPSEGAASIMLGFNRRFDPTFSQLRTQVAGGAIGRLEQLVITSRDPSPPPEHYIAASGGIFRDQTIHDFDTVRSFVPRIVSVHATGANAFSPEIREHGDHDSAVITLRGADDELITIINSRHSVFGHDQRIEAFGSAGMLQAGNVTPTTVRHFGADGTESASPYVPFFLERYADAYRAELDAFVDAASTGAEPSPGYDDGLLALELAEAAVESARTGRTIHMEETNVRS